MKTGKLQVVGGQEKKSGRPNSHCGERICAVLSCGLALPVREIAKEIGLSYETTRKAIAGLRTSTPKKVYVYDWSHIDAQHVIPVYALGSKRDKPKPHGVMHRNRFSDEELEAMLLREREKKAREALAQQPKRDPFVEAFYGPYRRAA